MPTIVKPAIAAPAFSPRRLRAAREGAGLTLGEVGQRLGRTWRTVIRYEQGEILPSVHALGALAHVLGCTIDSLFEMDQE